jgi:hypothetical protein
MTIRLQRGEFRPGDIRSPRIQIVEPWSIRRIIRFRAEFEAEPLGNCCLFRVLASKFRSDPSRTSGKHVGLAVADSGGTLLVFHST